MLTPTLHTTLTALHGGSVLRADGQWDDAPLQLDGAQIADGPTQGKWLDASGCLVLPGIEDFHGDAFERQIMPRPKVRFPLDVALLDTDKQLAANGITTALHGITYSWEGGLRGRETAEGLFDALTQLAGRLQVEHLVHLRFECHNVAGEEAALRWLKSGRVSLLAFNEHLPAMRARSHKLQEYADRAGTDIAGFLARMDTAAARCHEVPLVVERLALQARRLGIPMASHDDTDIAARDEFQMMDCRISEFPLTREVAEHARKAGSPVVCGAPNVLRGGSHVGAPSAAELAREGLCSILASDYYYPAPLHAAFKLAASGALPLADAWALVSRNPAQALGLSDRGRLEAGQRADVLLVTRAIRHDHIWSPVSQPVASYTSPTERACMADALMRSTHDSRHTRYAIYFAPVAASLHDQIGTRWLGRDARSGAQLTQPAVPGISAERLAALTCSPRRYGLHATLKPPFQLHEDRTLTQLEAAVTELAKVQAPMRFHVTVQPLDGFLAWQPIDQHAHIGQIAAACVQELDAFRQPPHEAELTRRRAAPLTPRQDAHLLRWGYPFVLEDFRFHITLSERLVGEEAALLKQALNATCASLADVALDFNALDLFVQGTPDADFMHHKRFAFGQGEQSDRASRA